MGTIAANLGQFISVTRGCFDDIDVQARQMAGYDQRYQQLSGGEFKGSFATYAFGDLGINVEHTNRALLQGGSTPRTRRALSFISPESSPVTLNGQEIGFDSAVYWDGGYDFEAHLAEQSTIWVIDIADSLLDSPPALTVPRGTVTSGRCVEEIRSLISAGIDAFTRNPSTASQAAAIRTYCEEVTAQINLLVSVNTVCGARRAPREQRLRLFRRGRDYIRDRLEEGIKINDMCSAVSASRRALENAFLETVRLSPFRYARALQLNQIRRELQRSDASPQRVGDIAAKWGIWHWSRFAREYRDAFGELPSQTKRGRSGSRDSRKS